MFPVVSGTPPTSACTVSEPCQPGVDRVGVVDAVGGDAGRRAQLVGRRRRREESRRAPCRPSRRTARAAVAVALPAGSVATAGQVVLADGERRRPENVAVPAANVGEDSVSVVPPFVIVAVTFGVSVEKARSVSKVAKAWWKLPQRFDGRRERDRRRRRVDPQVERRAAARRGRDVGHVDAQLGRGRERARRRLEALGQRHAQELRDEAEARGAAVGRARGGGRDGPAHLRRATGRPRGPRREPPCRRGSCTR